MCHSTKILGGHLNVKMFYWYKDSYYKDKKVSQLSGAFDLGLAVSVPLPIVTGIFVLLWFQSRLT